MLDSTVKICQALHFVDLVLVAKSFARWYSRLPQSVNLNSPNVCEVKNFGLSSPPLAKTEPMFFGVPTSTRFLREVDQFSGMREGVMAPHPFY